MNRESPTDAIVAIPAHDEEELLPRCLDGVLAAVARAGAAGVLRSATVVVAAHRCGDGTADLARRRLVRAPVQGVVLVDVSSATIAEVRRAAVDAGAAPTADPARTWVFSTDADSVVPPDWITGILEVAARERAAAVAGLVDVVGWSAPAEARSAYRDLVSRRIDGDRHDHAYGANLAVRLDAYRTVGGFTARRHGEDRDLLRRLRAAGLRVATPLAPRVVTSGRDDPRCPDGLGALLRRLAAGA